MRVLVAILLSAVLAGCSASTPTTRPTRPSAGSEEPETGQGTVTSGIDDLADAAASAASGLPTLLRVVNHTDRTVVLTSADGEKTIVISAGRSVQFTSERPCSWMPLTATTTDGTVIDKYGQPCHGQTWQIQDEDGASRSTASVPACTTDQLDATWDGIIGALAGSTIVWVGLTNVGDVACSLPSSAPRDLAGLDPAGAHAIPTDVARSRTWGIAPVHVLRPGEPAGFALDLPGAGVCDPFPEATYPRLRFDLGTGAPLTVSTAGAISLSVACPHLDVSVVGTTTDGPSGDATFSRVPPCHASDLTPRVRPRTDAAMSHIANLVDLRNTSDQTCRLTGYPQAVAVGRPGHDPVTGARGTYFPTTTPAPVAPGDTTTLVVETTTACGTSEHELATAPRYHDIRITIDDQVLQVTAHRGLYVACGVRFSRFTSWR